MNFSISEIAEKDGFSSHSIDVHEEAPDDKRDDDENLHK
jgi:hypothetical protein